ELLDQLKVALAQLKLRPKDSPEVARSSAAAFQSLGAFLDQTPRLVLAPAPDGLRVNGQRLGAKNFSTVTVESALIAPFLDAGIRELARLLDAAPEDLRPGLRKVGAIIVDAYRHDPHLVEALKPFLDSEARDLMPAWLTDEARGSDPESGAQARARVLLARPA